MELLVAMAVPREGITVEDEGHRFATGRIEILDWDAKSCTRRIDYVAPPEHLAPGLSVRFTGGAPYRSRWYQMTSTEIVIYDTDTWSVERVISHPSFNDLHGVAVTDEHILVVNTGLEMVQCLTHDGEIVREHNMASGPTWERFSRERDYRTIGTTKPHDVHVNHAFQLDGQWWITRCLRGDAVRLEDPKDRIEMGVGQPHDGIVRGDFIYFTTTNAHLVVVSALTRKVEEVLDLNRLNPTGSKIGWCRGLEVEGTTAYVGFTRLRRSKWHGAFDTVKDVLRGRKRNSHIERIDMQRRELVDSYDYAEDNSSAIFALMSYDRVLGRIPV